MIGVHLNELITELKEIEILLIDLYQQEAIGNTSYVLKQSIRINELLIDINLKYTNVTSDIIEIALNSTKPKLKIVK